MIGHLFNDPKFAADILANNGVNKGWHCLGSLWRGRTPTRSTITGYVVNDPELSSLTAAIVRAGLAGALDSDEVNLTLFAPTQCFGRSTPWC
jgi:hypothetical protein